MRTKTASGGCRGLDCTVLLWSKVTTKSKEATTRESPAHGFDDGETENSLSRNEVIS